MVILDKISKKSRRRDRMRALRGPRRHHRKLVPRRSTLGGNSIVRGRSRGQWTVHAKHELRFEPFFPLGCEVPGLRKSVAFVAFRTAGTHFSIYYGGVGGNYFLRSLTPKGPAAQASHLTRLAPSVNSTPTRGLVYL